CYLQSGSEGILHCLSGDGAQPAYRLDDQQLTFHFAAGDFTQVNAEINRQMVNQALDWLAIQPGERVLDLFCGVGNFSLPLARAGRRRPWQGGAGWRPEPERRARGGPVKPPAAEWACGDGGGAAARRAPRGAGSAGRRPAAKIRPTSAVEKTRRMPSAAHG